MWNLPPLNIFSINIIFIDFLVSQMVNRLPTMCEAQVQSLGWEDFLEKKIATHSGILAWKIPRIEESAGLLSMGP